MSLTKISGQTYRVDGTEYLVENVRGRWDAYLPHGMDDRLHVWESLAHSSRAKAVAAVRDQVRSINRAVRVEIRAVTQKCCND